MPTLIPPGPNIVNFFRSLREGKEVVVTPELIKDSSVSKETSFAYEPITYPLKNTQQINLDWSRFENHVFFSSAEKKSEIAIDQIINNFPFDGTKAEYENFFNNLTGFDKWVFDEIFPKHKGYLNFPTDQFMSIDDKSGSTHRALSRGTSGNPVVNPPKDKSFTVEFWIKPIGPGNIFYKGNTDGHIKISIVNSDEDNKKIIKLFIKKDSIENSVEVETNSNEWCHVAFVWEKTITVTGGNQVSSKLFSYLNGSLVSNEVGQTEKLEIDSEKLTFGGSGSFCLDEFRIFHEARTQSQINQYYKKSIFATEELKLYYKFNEPSGFNLIIDSSGNSLHGTLPNNISRSTKNSSENPVPLEKDELCVVLFPSYPELKSSCEEILETAIEYDKENPNLITKLIPQHYLDLGSIKDNTEDLLDADKKQNYSYAEPGNPKQFKPDPVQIISSFLYIWARFFDEIKIYIDSFSTLNNFNYEENGSIPDNFLLDAINKMGFFMPPMLNNTSLAQYLDGEDIGDQITGSDSIIKKVQTEITRRVLVNLPQVIRSKGTHHSIKTFLRSVGINPNKTLRIREYGGATARRLSQLREKRIDDIIQLLFHKKHLIYEPKFETNLFIKAKDINGNDIFKEKFLKNDWTVEGTFYFPEQKSPITLFSIVSGSATPFSLKLETADEVSSLNLFYGTGSILICSTQIPSPFNDEICTIAFGRDSNVAAQKDRFFVKWGQPNISGEEYSSESIVEHINLDGNDEYKLNMSGEFRASGIKMWTKAISAQEFSEHCKNFKSVGTDNAKDNFLFYNRPDITEKLKFHFIGQQQDKFSTSGELSLDDFSCNEHAGKITGLDDSINYHLVSQVEYSHLTPYFDEATTNDKIRIRGLENPDPLNDPHWVGKAPYHEIPVGEDPLDDNRLSIEFSLVDALNRDIINIFSTLDEIENAIGSPEVAFQPEYPDLEVLRNSYFEKLRDKMNFKGFFEFFRWFDQSISRFIEQLVPRKTNFKGTNFVIESHMLERAKLEIESSGMYKGIGRSTGIFEIPI